MVRYGLILFNFVGFGHFRRSRRDIFFCWRTWLFKLAKSIICLFLIVILFVRLQIVRMRIGIVPFECFEQLELCLSVLFLQLQFQFLYFELSPPFLDLRVLCLPLYSLDFFLEHVTLVVNLVAHLLDLVGKPLQLPIVSKLLWLSLSLLPEELSRYVSVKATTMSVF